MTRTDGRLGRPFTLLLSSVVISGTGDGMFLTAFPLLGAARTLTIAFWLWALAVVGLATTSEAPVAIGLFFVLGMGDGLWRVLTVTLRQRLTPNRLLGRVNSAYRMVAQGVIPLGAAFGGGVAKLFGVRAPFVVAAGVFVVIAVLAPRLLRPAEGA